MNAAETMLYMSNTAHQREVADLKAAGLNPVLSAGGSGASTPNISDTGSSATSAKAIRAAGKANPLNKALDVIKYNQRALWNKVNGTVEQFPEGAGSDVARHPGSTSSNSGQSIWRTNIYGESPGTDSPQANRYANFSNLPRSSFPSNSAAANAIIRIVRILDPALGSGMSALQAIDRAYR